MSKLKTVRITDGEEDFFKKIGMGLSEFVHKMVKEKIAEESGLAELRMQELVKKVDKLNDEINKLTRLRNSTLEEINKLKEQGKSIDQKRISIKEDLESKKKELFAYLQLATDQWENLRMDYSHKLALLKSRVKIFNQDNSTKFDPEESAKEMLDSIGMNKLF